MRFLFISMFNVHPLFLLLLGFCVSTMSGFYGIGGGWLITPALNILGVPMPFAIGTSLVYIIIVSGIGTIMHRKIKNVKYNTGIIIGISSILGVYLGKRLITYFEQTGSVDHFVRLFYIFFLFALGIFMAVEQKFSKKTVPKALYRLSLKPSISIKIDEKVTISVSFWTLAISGVAIGFLKSTMGVGGGFVLLPALVYLVKLPLPVAAGTSLFTVLLSGFSGAVAYIVSNNIDWAGVFYMTVTSLAGAVLGTAATVKVDNDKIKIFFAVTLFLGGVSVLLKELRFDLLSNTFIFGVAGISTLLIIYAFFIGGFLRKNYKSMDSV